MSKLLYYIRQLLTFDFFERLIRFCVKELLDIDGYSDFRFMEDKLKTFGEKLIKSVAKKPAGVLMGACKMVTGASCGGVLDGLSLKQSGKTLSFRFLQDGVDVKVSYDLVSQKFKE